MKKMKNLKLYLCEICGTIYNDKKKATDCENSHKPWNDIIDYSYKANSKYPETLTIAFVDNHKIIYYRGKELD